MISLRKREKEKERERKCICFIYTLFLETVSNLQRNYKDSVRFPYTSCPVSPIFSILNY